jgi:hypothetical protein
MEFRTVLLISGRKKKRIYTEQGTKELLAHAHWHWDDITYPFTVIYAMYSSSL